ncbi:MAG: Flp family type IVb pilin [Proteobacteria bacterium]|uniref:Flp family type IVb pilin n=1 Tax=Aquabacterium sp. TaxID=1872578 RepID=UPI0035C7122A|nr:Flp family type IVb pilin [Pseudomonadota bacterium]
MSKFVPIHSQRGVVAIEYALVAAGIAAIVALFFTGDNSGLTALLKDLFAKISTAA